jgi:hypothetical protein
MPTGIELSAGILTGTNKPVDSKYGPYTSTAAALADIPAALRYQGLTVGIATASGVVEYWFKAGVADSDFVEKTTGSGGVPAGALNAVRTFVDNTPLLNTLEIVNGAIVSWNQENTWLLLNGIWSDEGYWNDGSPI